MALEAVSPQIQIREIDLSTYTPAFSPTSVAMVGTATKGPLNTRVLITSQENFVKTFGTPTPAHKAMYAAMQYLREGTRLWYVRVESGSTPSEAAETPNMHLLDDSTYTWQAATNGSWYNGVLVTITHGSPLNIYRTLGDDVEGNVGDVNYSTTFDGPLVPGSITVTGDGTVVGVDDGEGTISGTGISGTVNYLTGAVVVEFSDAVEASVVFTGRRYSTFTLTLSRTVNTRPVILQVFRNLSLDPNARGHAGQYYLTVLARSGIIAVPDLGDPPQFPQAEQATLVGGTDGLTGIGDDDYIGVTDLTGVTGLQLFRLPEQVEIEVLAVPGVTSKGVAEEIVAVCEDRHDCIGIIDPPANLSVQSSVDWADGANLYSSSNAIVSSYVAMYYPWLFITDPYTGAGPILVPPSGFVAEAYARTDHIGNVWDAPAGVVRGRLSPVLRTYPVLNQGDRDLLYQHRINPIADLVGQGIAIWGQRTAQDYPSSLDRVGARRLLLALEKVIIKAAGRFVFEPINEVLYLLVRSTLQPYLDSLVRQQALHEAKVVCDTRNNTAETIDNNELHVAIYLKLPHYAEVVVISFVLLSTGASVEEAIATVSAV